MSSKVLPESELCKSFRGDANQLHTKALLENGGEAYTIFFELYISSVALIFYVIPPKLTVMYSTDESYKTICLTKYIYIYTQEFEFQIHLTLCEQQIEVGRIKC